MKRLRVMKTFGKVRNHEIVERTGWQERRYRKGWGERGRKKEVRREEKC